MRRSIWRGATTGSKNRPLRCERRERMYKGKGSIKTMNSIPRIDQNAQEPRISALPLPAHRRIGSRVPRAWFSASVFAPRWQVRQFEGEAALIRVNRNGSASSATFFDFGDARQMRLQAARLNNPPLCPVCRDWSGYCDCQEKN